MSESTTTTVDEAPEQGVTDEVESDTGVDADDAQEAPEDDTPDWRKDFDADKAADRIRKLQSEAKNLRTRAKEAEEKAQGVDEKDQRITALEAATLRYEVGYDLGLPKELVGRLNGQTREELIEDAKSLLDLVKAPVARTRKPVEALRGGGEPEQAPEERDLDKIGSRMFRR